MLNISGQPIIPGCTAPTYRIEMYNSNEALSTPVITLTLTVDPAQFALSPDNTGGFSLTSVPSANPNFPTYVDFTRTIVLSPEEFAQVDFQATVPPTFLPGLDPQVNIYLFASFTPPPPEVGCPIQDSEVSFFPSFSKQIGTNGQTTSLEDVATDNPNDGLNELNALYAVTNAGLFAIPHQDVVINGTLEVDIDYAFTQNSNLHLMPDAQILVNKPGSIFIIDGAKVKSCDAMWQSIDVSNGAYLALWNSEVSDGKVAVDLKSNGSVECNDNIFKNNNTSLSATGAIAYLGFDGNTITATGALKTPFVAQGKPKVGVELSNVPTAVVLHGTGLNQYSNLYNGIIAKGTTLSVKNSVFKDITEGASTAGVPFSGHGIHVENNTTDRKLTQEGLGDGSASAVSFDNCTFGIFNIGTNLDAKNNRMVSMVTGIESRNCQNKDISIKQNRITTSLTGINMFQNAKVKSAIIEDNLVIVSDIANIGGISNATGIRAEEFPVSNLNYRINENTVNMAHGRRGISLTNGNLISIRDNTVWNSGTVATNGMGIDVVGSRYLPISCNVMDGNTLGSNTIGLHVEGTFESRARCNQAMEHNVGVNYFGMCDGAQLRGNQMSTAANGFVLGTPNSSIPQGWIGKQRFRGNLWNGGFSSFPAWFPGAGFDIASNHSFLIDPNQTPAQLLVQNPPGVQPNSGWFVQQTPNPGESTYTCPSNCNGDPDFPQVLTEFDDLIANGSDLGATVCIAATNWTAKRHLYTRLQDNPGLASGNLLMQGFLGAQANTTVGAFYNIESQIQQLLTPSANDESLLGSNRAAVDAKSDSIASMEAQIAGGGLTEQQILQLRAQQAQLQSGISSIQAQSDTILGNISNQRTNTAASIRQSNSAINATQAYELNQQQANDIFLQTVAVGNTNYTTAQTNTLLSIAEQCALCGGDAVFMARAMYSKVDPSRKFVDQELCQGAQPIKQPLDSKQVKFSIMPNPASYWALIAVEGGGRFEGQAQIIDISGKLVGSFVVEMLEGEPYLLDLSALQTGFYTVRLTQESNVLLTEKLIIAR